LHGERTVCCRLPRAGNRRVVSNVAVDAATPLSLPPRAAPAPALDLLAALVPHPQPARGTVTPTRNASHRPVTAAPHAVSIADVTLNPDQSSTAPPHGAPQASCLLRCLTLGHTVPHSLFNQPPRVDLVELCVATGLVVVHTSQHPTHSMIGGHTHTPTSRLSSLPGRSSTPSTARGNALQRGRGATLESRRYVVPTHNASIPSPFHHSIAALSPI
jgi:hypothetical protein